jgi:hypothetical protein
VAADDDRLEPEPVEQLDRIGGVVVCPISRLGPFGVAVTAHGHGERPDRLGQQGQQRLPGALRVGDPVQQQHGRAVWIAALDIGHA